MTDNEDNWTEHPTDCCCPRCGDPVTQKELVAESERVIAVLMKCQAKLAETIRDQIAFLDESKTVAIMAAILYGKCTEAEPEFVAKILYRNVQKTLEIDQTIVGSISA